MFICKGMKLDQYLTPYTKINSKCIKDFNIKPETMEDIENQLLNIDPFNDLAKETKAKINKWDYIKLKVSAQHRKSSMK